MKDAFARLLSSMKFWTTVLAMLCTIGAKYGIQVDADTQLLIAGFFAMLLGGQALADHGKEAAKLKAPEVKP